MKTWNNFIDFKVRKNNKIQKKKRLTICRFKKKP